MEHCSKPTECVSLKDGYYQMLLSFAYILATEHHSGDKEVCTHFNPSSMSKGDQQGNNQPASFRGEFSFVNKDAGNIDSKDHNAAVSWHVMNRYEQWKKQEQAKRLRESAQVPMGSFMRRPEQEQGESSVAQGSRQRSARQVSYKIPKRVTLSDASPISTSATPTVLPYGFNPWMSEQKLQIGYPGITGDPASGSEIPVSSDSTPSTQSSLFEGDAAPSSSVGHTVTPMDIPDNLSEPLGPSTQQLVDKLFSFAFDFFIPHTWPKETRHETQRYTYEVSRCWDDTIMIYQDRCYANAYLSLLAAALAVVTEDDDLAYRSRFFQGQAVTELRQRVARLGPQDPITFKAILKLFSSETLVDNTSVARTHLKMLRKLVNGAGGVIMMDTWFREDLLSCDCYFALRYDTRPLFPVRQWTPGPLNQPWKARLLASGVAEDHATGVDSQVEDAVMKAVVADLRELFRVHEYTQMHQIAADDQLLRWQQLRKFDCISRIADHHVNLTIYPHLFQRPLTQAYTCMAMALMTNMMLGSPEPVRFGLKLIAGLRSKMQESRAEVDAEDDNQHQYRGLRLWALYVGSLAERVHPVEAEEEGWFAGEFHSHAADTGLESWDGTRKTLRRFLFSVGENRSWKTRLVAIYRARLDQRGWENMVSPSIQLPLLLESDGLITDKDDWWWLRKNKARP
ncbi:hypothetical protein HRR86_007426 [Exophiala dermatitidis]|nr:hypothetical protein HRR77_006548 [Exophiala dermatitidis]KAJ4564582.1 hypothetical protein HRR79_005840 [Exophiala dermatitidis]KAJ4573030.1 hypothetical protein HRR82_006691 [Exophiala dermatitidis]KAJ4609638.1 hypothetical protein HRR85_006382 [Exophiala dermatitidis]KAJ4617065.1 hypothetical protein HRR86_007426 [Exophiala dermatitidis]